MNPRAGLIVGVLPAPPPVGSGDGQALPRLVFVDIMRGKPETARFERPFYFVMNGNVERLYYNAWPVDWQRAFVEADV